MTPAYFRSGFIVPALHRSSPRRSYAPVPASNLSGSAARGGPTQGRSEAWPCPARNGGGATFGGVRADLRGVQSDWPRPGTGDTCSTGGGPGSHRKSVLPCCPCYRSR